MTAPVPVPSQCKAAAYHRAAYVSSLGRHAPSSGPAAAGAASRHTPHRWALHQDMTLARAASWPADEPHQCITGGVGINIRAGLVGTTGVITLSSRNAGETEPRTFGAPDRAVTIPHSGRCAGEGVARRNNRQCGHKKEGDGSNFLIGAGEIRRRGGIEPLCDGDLAFNRVR